MVESIDFRLRNLVGAKPNSYWIERFTKSLGYWGERIAGELLYAYELSKRNQNIFDPQIDAALHLVEKNIQDTGVITKDTALAAELLLKDLSEAAKSFEVINVAHAHIDMNWMWSWDETVSITLDTIRTMLNLLEEYPQFTFAQSQASIYHIVEQHAPEMLDEIRAWVKDGRWEVTASHWVEADKNMPTGESLTRHLLYAKRYLSALLNIDEAVLNIDYEPDTFGHSIHVPEILSSGGVKYYYHCRGNEAPPLYRWQAPSGHSVIAYREPTWYNDHIHASLGSYIPDICRQTGLNTYLNVYGVGDHGGGPTRRDIERIIDMNTWPIYPKLRFGTYREFFALTEKIADQLPVLTGEQNFVFTGCYTSQTRIKTANRIGEVTLHEAELFNSIANTISNHRYSQESYESAWRNVLFNQFHDILPGSGVIETREHALGLHFQTMAIANSNKKLSLEKIASEIDTSKWIIETKNSLSEGAGVGFGVRQFKIGQVERGSGTTRIVHIFNSSSYDRKEVVEIILWDWQSPISTIVVKDSSGYEVPSQIIEQGFNQYWGHQYLQLLAYVAVPGCGYATFSIEEGLENIEPKASIEPRVEKEEQYVLENEILRVVFDTMNAAVRSFVIKLTNEELIDPFKPAGIFQFIKEDTSKGMTAWIVGRYMDVASLHQNVKIRKGTWGEARQSLHVEMKFGNRSSIKVEISLDRGNHGISYEVECDWQEAGKADTYVPQLNFSWPLAYETEKYCYDVPFGTIHREGLAHDVPANSFALAVPHTTNQSAIMMVTNNKYGFRGDRNELSVSLIRGSFDPDPYPELGDHHKFKFMISALRYSSQQELIETAYRFNHPFTVLSGKAKGGTQPLDRSFFRICEGKAVISAIKVPEEVTGKEWIVRIYETEGIEAKVKLETVFHVIGAYYVDASEKRIEGSPLIQCDSPGCLEVQLVPYSVTGIKISFV